MSDWYLMDSDGRTRRASQEEWLRWREEHPDGRRVAFDDVEGSRVSTVFLGLDHGFGDGPPVLFETLVFNGPLDGEMDRYYSIESARAGHAAMVARVRAGK